MSRFKQYLGSALIALLFAGCTEDVPLPPGISGDASSEANGDGDGDGDADAGCDENSAQTCDCDGGATGIAVCSNGHLGACTACVAESTGSSRCVPGTYVGHSMGTYSGGGAFWGLIPGWNVNTKNGIVLRLSNADEGSEFSEVNSGCLEARLPDGGLDTTAGGLLTGTVDCSTGRLDAVLRNYGERPTGLTLALERWYARGVVHATYDPATHSFNGTWEQHEPPDAFNMVAGGSGTLTIAEADAGVSDEGRKGTTFEECWGFAFPDEKFPDAGP
ncbi:MAG: hypothetical protein QM778_31190 [Myxococcales bacterium]